MNVSRSRLWRALCWSSVLVTAAVLVVSAQSRNAPAPAKLGQPGKDVSWVPTSEALIDKMFEMANVRPADYVIDLGSGDGRTVIAAAKRGAQALGIEYDANLVELARRSAAREGLGDKAAFVKADLFDTDFSRATVITMFLLPEINLKLRPKLLDLAPGTRIVSNTFTMEEWDADDTRTIGNGCASWCTALLWVVPAKVQGTWRFPQGDLKITQEFQVIRGTLTSSAGTVAIHDGKMRGDRISFTAGTANYSGRVTGNVMGGSVSSPAGAASWTAQRADTADGRELR